MGDNLSKIIVKHSFNVVQYIPIIQLKTPYKRLYTNVFKNNRFKQAFVEKC